jgi:very-short-patch-repair endonuclease
MSANAILDGLEYDASAGRLSYKGVRYVLIRPETLAALQTAVEAEIGPENCAEIMQAGGFTGGALSARRYREVFGYSDREIAEFMCRMGREIGWGGFTLVKLDVGKREMLVEVSGSPFAEAYLALRPSSPRPPSPKTLGEGGEQTPSPAAAGERIGSEGRYPRLRQPSRALIERARQLRQEATNAEQLLWELLRNRQLLDRKFRRQHTLGRFIADFFCDDARLVIEIDGAIHQELSQQERDHMRGEVLRQYGYTLLRFTNREVLSNTEHVLRTIAASVEAHTFEQPSPPLPQLRERGSGGEGVCHLIRGVLAGLGAGIFGGEVVSTEVACRACGDPACRFEVHGR